MKVEELFIGAWVLYKGTHNKILGIHKDDSGDYRGQIDDEFKQWYLLSEFKSIPITAEILEKNGFGKLVTYGTEKWLCNNFRLNVYSSDGTWRFCADTNRNENSVIYIRFVHELQHALKLCEIDKEIML